jgi:predicted outer membrane repeat protein
MESLEDRMVPAVIAVMSTADNNDAVITAGHAGTAADPFLAPSLRSAISFANAHPGGNTIDLAVAGDYKITRAGTVNESDNAAGEFAILNTGGDLTIQNTSSGAVAVDGNHLNRVFDINPNFDPNNPTPKFLVTLTGFTIENGFAADPNNPDGGTSSGGGIRDVGNASLTLNNMVITGNTATADGGGVAFENAVSVPWTFTVNNTTVTNNHAGDAGGGLETDGSGKIFLNSGTVISGNRTVNQGAGIWLDAIEAGTVFQSANLTVTDTLITDNAAETQVGGGIGNAGNGTVTIVGSTLSNNFAGMTGGGFGDQNAQGALVVKNSVFENNSATGSGGGIAAGGPTTSIADTLIRGNSSGTSGGGIFANGVTLTVQNSTLVNNTSSGNGGGIELDTTGTGTTVSTITNTTIANNSALNAAGANGGGIDAGADFTGTVSLESDTINGNFATMGGGIFWATTSGSGIGLENTILAQNGAPGGGADAFNAVGDFSDQGGNLIGISGTGSGNAFTTSPTTQTGTTAAPLNPLLGPIENNGGPTIGAPSTPQVLLSEALLPGSPAIDKGVTNGAPTMDGRGFTRPEVAGQNPDAGAFEFQDAQIGVTITPSVRAVFVGGTETFTITLTNTGVSTLPADNNTLSAVLSGGVVPVSGTPMMFAVPSLAPGQSATFTVTALATAPGTGTITVALTSHDTAPNTASSTETILTASPPPPPMVTADPPSPFTGLTPQERFVQALYLDDLGRAGAVSELDGWVAVLNASGARTVVSDIEGSFEARDRIVQGWYQTFLGRSAQGGEENGFVNLLATQTEEQVLGLLLSSGEFYARAQTLSTSGTADQRYVAALYQLLLNRQGDAAGIAGHTADVATMGRQAVVLSFLSSAEYRTEQVGDYYTTLLHRPADQAGLNGAVASGLDLRTLFINIEASPEFFTNG